MIENITFLPGSQKIEIESFIDLISKNQEFEIYSSGSTGVPKKFVFSMNQALVSARKTIDFFRLNSCSKIYVCLDIQTVAAKMQIIRAFLCNCHLICGPVNSLPIEDKFQNLFDFISLVPMQLFNILSKNPSLLKNKTVLVGGAVITDQLYKLIQKNEINVFESYGMTETLSHIALSEVNHNDRKFKSLPGIELSVDQKGCLIIDYPEIGLNQLITNDIVELNKKNSFYLKGRIDFVINSGGKKIHPEIIEKTISKKMQRDVLIGKTDDNQLGEKVIILIQGNPFDVNAKSFSYLKNFEKPKLYAFIESFPIKNSKINRIEAFSKYRHDWREVL